jgi:EAL domain-containing protein (putative c-di-GMP-specific phosphodiesterase class I)
VEALARWQHPRLGAVSPARFIPVAEEIGIVTEIGDWVLRAACRQVADWRAQGLAVGSISVNISVQQLERDSLTETLRGVLAETGLAPADLELEVTESMIMEKNRRALEAMDALRGLGVRLSVDDFGTGYSSLGRLNRMPIDRLKIDASFVRDISQDSKDEAIARAIIGIGRDLGLEVIAEGVEREEQAVFLAREGCQIAQGYLFGHPLPPEDLLLTWRTTEETSAAGDPPA